MSIYDDYILHYGTPRHSGRYPWGSGEDPYQSNKNFVSYIGSLRKSGLSDKDIASSIDMTTTQLRAKLSLSSAEVRAADVAQAMKLKEKGHSNTEIGRRMGINESSVRSLLDPARQERAKITRSTANMLKKSVEDKKYIDVGAGVENHIGITRTKLNTAIAQLQEEGYKIQYIKVPQVGNPGKYTTVKVLTKDDVSYSEIYKNRDQIQLVTNYTTDKGRTYLGMKPVQSVSTDRIQIRYAEDGGTDKDGIIELREGVNDLNMGASNYAQVRIGVDDKYYLKGMAVYSNDIPKGKDIIFNTNKSKSTSKEDVMKAMKDDKDNPFGATISRQSGALNIVNEEGAWSRWSRKLSSQMLSKQRPELIKQQLDLTYNLKKEDFDEIMSLTNPVVKQKLLNSFADGADSSAVDLKAAGLPRTASHVILPFPSMKETEIYAPKYRNGEKVVLIRHPHGGIFEIPELTVNNRHPQAKKSLGNALDAVGINPKTAAKLSGADFDGDTVLVIPNNKGEIKTASSLKSLQNFDPRIAYPAYEGMPRISAKQKGTKMGDVSNLITDMTIKGASLDEIAKAVKHSMVVIDAEKHNLNYKQSYIDNNISALKKKYQGSANAGASTLVSRASSEARPGTRKVSIDPKTGRKMYTYTNETYVNKQGKTVLKTERSTKMYETEDAFTLSSGTRVETVYATYANRMKALANQARKEAIAIRPDKMSPSAKKTYAKEVETLTSKLDIAVKNKPLERQAQLLANKTVSLKREANPNMDKDDLKKTKSQALAGARVRVGAKKEEIEITDSEWRAIQEGAVSANTLRAILDNTNEDRIRKLATPRTKQGLSSSKIARAKAMANQGYTQAEIADALGVSTTTIADVL